MIVTMVTWTVNAMVIRIVCDVAQMGLDVMAVVTLAWCDLLFLPQLSYCLTSWSNTNDCFNIISVSILTSGDGVA